MTRHWNPCILYMCHLPSVRDKQSCKVPEKACSPHMSRQLRRDTEMRRRCGCLGQRGRELAARGLSETSGRGSDPQ